MIERRRSHFALAERLRSDMKDSDFSRRDLPQFIAATFNSRDFVLRKPAGILCLLLWLLLIPTPNSVIMAGCSYEFAPGLSLVETYNDNIFLRSTDKTSDLTSAISPLASFNVQCVTKGISLSYQPSFVFYKRYPENDTVRHSAALSAYSQIGEYTRLDFQDSIYRTEEPIEPLETIYAARRTRSPYFRNNASIKASHQFGAKDNFFLGYSDDHLENEDPLVEDARIQTPFAGLAYWFDIRNGLEFNARYSISDYDTSADFKSNSESLRLTHLLDPESSVSAYYSYLKMDHKAGRTDYEVHTAGISYSTTLWRYFQLGLGVGQHTYDPEEGDRDSKINYYVDLTGAREGTIEFERGSVSFGLQSGHRQEYIDAENSGFVTFWSANSSIRYSICENLNANAGLNYREDRFTEQADRLDAVWSGSAGLVYSCRNWLVFSLNGQHMERDSSTDNDYDVNQVVLVISLQGGEALRKALQAGNASNTRIDTLQRFQTSDLIQR